MNYRIVFGIIGKTMIMEALLMLFPMVVGFIYQENTLTCFLVPIIALLAIGIPLSLIKIKDKLLYVKEGFVSVALVWIVISLFGAIPFVIEGSIPNYVDAFFETVSGFTTTGASILSNVEVLSRDIMFWRLFTHWIGGMGVLVFVLAYQLIVIGVKTKQKNELIAEKTRLEQELADAEADVKLWQKEWKIEERARQLDYVYKKDKEKNDK